MTNLEAIAIAEHETRFRKELAEVINRHSRENGSDTPDFILADYLADCLAAWDKAATHRTQWYGGKERMGVPPMSPTDSPHSAGEDAPLPD